MKIDLPDGGWADMCAPRKVPERKRRSYQSAVMDLNAATGDLPRDPENPANPDEKFYSGRHNELMSTVFDMQILCFVREWSFGPVTLEALQDLDGDAYDVLKKWAIGHANEMMPDFGPDPDPKAPTSP